MIKYPPADTRDIKRHRFNRWVGKMPLEEGLATHTNILALRISRTKEPGRLWSIGSQESDTTEVT